MAAATLSVGVLLAILEAVPEIRVPFRVYSHHSSKLGGKSQGGRRDRNQPYRESPQRECITLDRPPLMTGASQSDALTLRIFVIRLVDSDLRAGRFCRTWPNRPPNRRFYG